jgi:hypothetical protein
MGMTIDDFQNKFLKIGYSKRNDGNIKTGKDRPFIGRKGIGKLALLSCSKKVHIASKIKGGDIIGGVIDNTELDNAIKDDKNSEQYNLGNINKNIKNYFRDINSGTIIIFDDIKHTENYIKNKLALFFRFALIDAEFNIFLNNTRITIEQLKDLAENTEFIWNINNLVDPYLNTLTNLLEIENIISPLNISGFIATTNKYSKLQIGGTDEKVSLDLFVNGRLRERDILQHIPSSRSRIVENYIYGQIHFNDLDNGSNEDIFTSSRESIITDNLQFQALINEIERIYKIIIKDWDKFRRKHHKDGDSADTTITLKERKAEELFNQEMKDIFTPTTTKKSIIIKGSEVEKWANGLTNDARFNIPCYTECFIAENLLRKYIEFTKQPLSPEATVQAKNWETTENDTKNIANISYNIRQSTDDIYYLDMDGLSNLVDKAKDKQKNAGISRSATIYKPLRNAIGHTALLTDIAKQALDTEFKNIKARLSQILEEFQRAKK